MNLAKAMKAERSPSILLLSTCWKRGLYSVSFKEEGECILCTSHRKTTDGYHRLTYKEKIVYLHRIIYSFYNTDLVGDLLVRHLCNNPNCCNPKHLAIGTHKDNRQDWVKAGSIGWERDNIKYGAALSNEEVIEIFLSKGSQRYLAGRFNVSKSTIANIKHRECYATITEGL